MHFRHNVLTEVNLSILSLAGVMLSHNEPARTFFTVTKRSDLFHRCDRTKSTKIASSFKGEAEKGGCVKCAASYKF